MAAYSSILQSMSKQLGSCFQEIAKLREELHAAQGISDVKPEAPDNVISMKNELVIVEERLNSQIEKLRVDSKNEKTSIEAALTFKLEQYIANSIKNRLDMVLQSVKSQIIAEMNIKMDELKEELVSISCQHPLERDVRSEENNDGPLPSVTPLDIEALTKDILSDTASAISSQEQTNDFAINTVKKRILRKK